MPIFYDFREQKHKATKFFNQKMNMSPVLNQKSHNRLWKVFELHFLSSEFFRIRGLRPVAVEMRCIHACFNYKVNRRAEFWKLFYFHLAWYWIEQTLVPKVFRYDEYLTKYDKQYVLSIRSETSVARFSMYEWISKMTRQEDIKEGIRKMYFPL